MLIVGAKGFAKEVLEIFYQKNELRNLVFFDNVNKDIGIHLYDQFPILKSKKEAQNYFNKVDKRFTIGIGNPKLRKRFYDEFIELGGAFTSTISINAEIGSYGVHIEKGCNILGGVKISNDTIIGKGCIIYYNSIITHDVLVGDFCEISPDVKLLGRCKIGNRCQLGAGSVVLPNIEVGNDVVVGAGAVITQNLPDNCVAVGVPAKIIKQY